MTSGRRVKAERQRRRDAERAHEHLLLGRLRRGECTRCGRARRPGEEVWCGACAAEGRARDPKPRVLTIEESAAYQAALLSWAMG